MGRRSRCRGLTLVETMIGALVLGICAVPILRGVTWVRASAADATIDALVANALGEQASLVRSSGRTIALTPGTTNSSKSLGNGVTLAVARTVAAVSGKPRLYDLTVVGTWTSRGQGGKARSLTLETYVFAPDN